LRDAHRSLRRGDGAPINRPAPKRGPSFPSAIGDADLMNIHEHQAKAVL